MKVDHATDLPVNDEFVPGNLYQSLGGDLFLCTSSSGTTYMMVNVCNGNPLTTINYERYINVTELYTLKRN